MSFKFDNITLEYTSERYSFFNKYLCDEIKEELNYEYDINDCDVELSGDEEITLAYEGSPERIIYKAGDYIVFHKLLFNAVYTVIRRYGQDPLEFVNKFKFSLFNGDISFFDLSVINGYSPRNNFMIYGEHAEQEHQKFKIKDIHWFVYQIIMMQSLYNNRAAAKNRTIDFLLKRHDKQINFFNFNEIKEFITLLGTYGGPTFSNIDKLGKYFSYQYAQSIKTFIWDNLHHNNVKLHKKIAKHTDFMKMDLIPLCQLIISQKAFKK